MRIPMTLPRRKLLLILIPSLIAVAYLGSTVFPSSPKKDKNIVRVNNLTRSCDFSVERHKDHLKLLVQNNSDKAVTAFVLTSLIDSRTVFTFREEFIFSEGDNVIPPGQSYDKEIGSPDSSNGQTEVILNFSSVIYADGSSEGDPHTIRDTWDSRLGTKNQIMKILPLLNRVAQLSDTEIGSYWNKTAKQDFDAALNLPNRDSLLQLKRKLANDNESYEESEQFKLGVHAGKEDILRKYQELTDIQEQNGAAALRERIVELRKLYAKMLNRF